MTRKRISLAAGIMPEATPTQLVEAAAFAEFDLGGMWVEQTDWTPATTRAVKRQLTDAGVELLDVEVAWIKAGQPDPWLSEVVEIAMELGAANVLCVSSDPDHRATAEKFQLLVDRAKGSDVRINLEFGLFTEVKSLPEARAILERIDGANKGLLCDALHWSRSGGTGAEIAALPREWIGYAQPCDAPAHGPDMNEPADIIDDAVNGRLAMGAGGLDLATFIDALPNEIPLAIEERSQVLRDAYPDLNERAAEVARTSRAWLDRHYS